jgi:hypothetical protein
MGSNTRADHRKRTQKRDCASRGSTKKLFARYRMLTEEQVLKLDKKRKKLIEKLEKEFQKLGEKQTTPFYSLRDKPTPNDLRLRRMDEILAEIKELKTWDFRKDKVWKRLESQKK